MSIHLLIADSEIVSKLSEGPHTSQIVFKCIFLTSIFVLEKSIGKTNTWFLRGDASSW